ncbi:MAG: glutathione S-transferase family protein [Pseudomonadota bacterium]
MASLLHHPLCAFSRSIRLALAECGLEADLVQEKPWEWRPEFLAINPAGTLPVLLRDGHVPIAGSYAISEWLSDTLEERPATGFQPFPGDPAARAETRRLVEWFHHKFYEDVTDCLVVEKVFRRFGPQRTSPDMNAMRAGRENLRYHMAYIAHLTEARSWLSGDALSFADMAAAAHLSALDYLGEVPWEEFQSVKHWYALVKSRPSFRPLLQDRVAGFIPTDAYADLDF